MYVHSSLLTEGRRCSKNALYITETLTHTANGTFLIFVELSFNKTQYQAGFTDCRFTEKHQFELADTCLCVCSAVCTLLLTGRACSHLVHTVSVSAQHVESQRKDIIHS